jgi:branched-chain amino acid transport system ATP-binding protein
LNNESLVVDNINTYYGKSHILQGASLSLDGEIIAIAGRNGMGKTTLVKAIMGLIHVASGKIVFGGRDITNKKPYTIASGGIGYVPQGRELFPSLSVNEHLKLVARKNKNIWTRERILDLFPNLKKQPNQSATYLSGGEQQMLAIGRLLVNPSILIMDEPTEGLAPIIIESLAEICKKLLNLGVRILLVEQNLHFATSLSKNLYIMMAGRIVDKVDSKTLMDNADIREKYLGVGTCI